MDYLPGQNTEIVQTHLSEKFDSELYLPDPENEYSNVGSMYSVSVQYQDNIILCSGWRATSDCYFYNKYDRIWHKNLQLPGGGRHAMAGIVYDDLFLIIGGCASSGGYPVLNSVVALSNVTEKSWMHIAPMIERRSYHSCTMD